MRLGLFVTGGTNYVRVIAERQPDTARKSADAGAAFVVGH
jgi:hypothetical protein